MTKITTRQLELFQVSYQARVSKDFPPGLQLELESYVDIQDELLAKATARVLVERLEPFVIKRNRLVLIQVPKTWWDHFKLTYKDKWWMRFRDVKYKAITRDVEFTMVIKPMMAFPHISPPYPTRLGDLVRIFEYDEDIKEREINDDNS